MSKVEKLVFNLTTYLSGQDQIEAFAPPTTLGIE